MPKFVELHLSAFLDALASPEPTPGGGTAAAIAGAMGASLLMMVAGLAKSRTDGEDERVALAEARAALASVRERFSTLADADSEAFNQVLAAYRLPKNSDSDKAARRAAVQQAMTAATNAPLETLRTAGEAMRLGQIVAQHGSRSAVSDAGVGIGLLQAAADGAVANVRINVGSLEDEAFKKSAAEAVEEILQRIADDAGAARKALDR
jgi:glutamate formiminotransferase/formiminotetrahydrofolate cyclodeaminase